MSGARPPSPNGTRSSLTHYSAVRADVRALAAGLALGAAVGLLLGGSYLVGGQARAADATHGHSTGPATLAKTGGSVRAAPALRGPLDVTPVLTAVTSAPAQRFRGAANPGRDLDCLADAVYYEARGETPEGQEAIAQVVINRVRHPAFPKSVCGVVFQGRASDVCQFSFACNGAMNRPKEAAAWARAEQIAARALAGVVMPEVGAATNFHAAGSAPGWGLMRVAQVGLHVFYRSGGHAGPARPVDTDAQPAARTAHRLRQHDPRHRRGCGPNGRRDPGAHASQRRPATRRRRRARRPTPRLRPPRRRWPRPPDPAAVRPAPPAAAPGAAGRRRAGRRGASARDRQSPSPLRSRRSAPHLPRSARARPRRAAARPLSPG